MEDLQKTRSRDERLLRLIEILKAEADSQISGSPAARSAASGFRYPRSRWSAPTE